MLTAVVIDHSERIQELLNAKIGAACKAAADRLADSYVAGLQATIAPPHSRPGEIPHAYLGHKEGGYGPLNLPGEINNTPLFGFAKDQNEYLSEYIESAHGQNSGSVVGFSPSHVDSRRLNYLIGWDQGTITDAPGVRRPWVDPIYESSRKDMASDALEAMRESVPF